MDFKLDIWSIDSKLLCNCFFILSESVVVAYFFKWTEIKYWTGNIKIKITHFEMNLHPACRIHLKFLSHLICANQIAELLKSEHTMHGNRCFLSLTYKHTHTHSVS